MEEIRNIVGTKAFDALLNENINTPQKIITSDSKYLEDLTKLTLELVEEIKTCAAKEILKNKFLTANLIPAWKRISTGCQNIDNILKGGIPINGITEIYGCSGVGKTQLCLQLALQIQLPNQLELKNKEVLFISTEDIFPSKRLNQLATVFNEKFNLNIPFEDHIYLEHIADKNQLQICLKNSLPHFLAHKNVGLIIVDSIAGLFRSESENCNYAFRSKDFKNIAKGLNILQDQYNLAVVVVNQVTDNVNTGVTEPCLGLSWANNVTCRFCISKSNESSLRKFEVIFAPDLPPESTYFCITPNGLINAE